MCNHQFYDMEKIQPGKYVELGYDLYRVNPDGSETLVHQTDKSDPERIIFGVTRGMIRPLEEAIEGLEPGGKFDVAVKAADAFGMPDPEARVTLPRDVFEIDGKFDSERVKPGSVLPMMTADGHRISGVVTEVNDQNVIMDFNHPLAGDDVRFKGEILVVRDATPEELTPANGCHCHGSECGDDCGSHEGGCCGSCNCN